jgi:cbb3-type cytochrome oxidase maturation protein
MSDYLFLIPIAFALGATTLGVFVWCLRSGQYEDLDGAAERILFDDDAKERPLRSTPHISK